MTVAPLESPQIYFYNATTNAIHRYFIKYNSHSAVFTLPPNMEVGAMVYSDKGPSSSSNVLIVAQNPRFSEANSTVYFYDIDSMFNKRSTE